MVKILFNQSGDPLMAYGEKFFATTTGAPDPVKPLKPVQELDFTEVFDQYTISPWGNANDFPVQALDIIGRTGVLNTGLKYLTT